MDFLQAPTISNWAYNLVFKPDRYYQPISESELLKIIQSARQNKKQIRVVGSGHSWSDLIKTTDYLINLDQYNKVIDLDSEKMLLHIQSGAKLKYINVFLAGKGFALANLGSIAEQSAGGGIATGTHGSGTAFKILGDQLQAFKIIDGQGKTHWIDRDEDPEKFKMAVVHLGALGIVSEIKIKIVPAFQLHETTELVDFDVICKDYNRIINSADHVKFWWFPPVEKMLVYRYNRTQGAPNDSRFRQWFLDEFISVYAYRLLVKIGNQNINWRPKINDWITRYFIQPVNRIESSYKVFNVPEPPIHRETEWAFPIEKGPEVLQAYAKMIEEKGHKINFLQEIRFVKGDDFALSPCYQRDSIYVGAYLIGNEGWLPLLKDFEVLAQSFNGRPHWGKEFTADKAYLKKQYPNWEKFIALKKEMDAEQLFENALINTFFYKK